MGRTFSLGKQICAKFKNWGVYQKIIEKNPKNPSENKNIIIINCGEDWVVGSAALYINWISKLVKSYSKILVLRASYAKLILPNYCLNLF